jgi:NodT family efflux transporter outer membrane factor (OMF) lipoprotein
VASFFERFVVGANDGMAIRNTDLERGRAVSVSAVSRFGVLLAFAGCAVGPTFKKPQATVNESWRAGGDPRVSTQSSTDSSWWKTFSDSALDRLVELAYRQNLPLQIAGLRIVEARAQLAVVAGKQYPQVQMATASATALGLSENVVNIPNIPRHFGTYQIGFDAAWEVDLWGKYRRGVEAETATLLGSVASYDSALVSLAAEVARTYVVVRTFEVLIAQTEENVRVQQEALEIAESRFRNGATSELDPTQAMSLLQSTRAAIPELTTGLAQARNALSTLVGQPPGTVDALLAGPQEIPKAPAKVFVGVPAEMLRRRPDIRNAELLAAAQCARIGVAKA